MRLVIQRVSEASVAIAGRVKSSVKQGLMILVGIEPNDASDDIDWLVKKAVNLRIFDDEEGVMNQSVLDVKGGLLVISQFTLQARTKKGNRPSYINAAGPELAIPLYEEFVQKLEQASGVEVGTGEFGANMQVQLINDGPVTIIIDSKRKE
ncbi:D-tyrosyl-tRNA(Tyr) deacylase [Carboxylicivirga sp. A043]|uniref:D-aminoacyl-tRNA deacylase n=1 Tax=Carboxylicivirga litoralis TaxID=2816963 RepID=UPI0021CB06D0|nr:D-aminoacyl-tRNA deacylase [Carboxylicivirga sp. A043]MCU4156624.1 D-tyrosyl-tRNA(Tyr) deacylase [Carboxylicivirga sp. A043]